MTKHKLLLVIALLMSMLASCTPEYIAKDNRGNPILIKDRDGVIQDALKLGLDSIYVVEYTRDNFSYPLRWMGDNHTNYWKDTLSDGRVIAGVHTYRIIKMNTVFER